MAFIVNTVNLVAQQKEKFQIFLGSQYSVSDMSGAKSKDIPFKYLLQENDIVVLTAQILVNALKDKDNRVALSDISLLIFDECHHAQKGHPYNKVMEQYLALRLQPGSRHELPQVRLHAGSFLRDWSEHGHVYLAHSSLARGRASRSLQFLV